MELRLAPVRQNLRNFYHSANWLALGIITAVSTPASGDPCEPLARAAMHASFAGGGSIGMVADGMVGHNQRPARVAFSRSQVHVSASVGMEGELILWNLLNRAPHWRKSLSRRVELTAVAVSTEGQVVVVAGKQGVLSAFDSASGQLIREFSFPATTGSAPPDLNAVAISRDLRVVAVAEQNGTLRILSLEDGRELQQLKMAEIQVIRTALPAEGLKLSDDGEYLAAYTGSHLSIYGLRTAQELMRVSAPGHDGKFVSGLQSIIHAVELTPDWRFAAMSLYGGSIQIIDLQTGKNVRELNMPAQAVHAMRFSENYKLAPKIVAAGRMIPDGDA